MACSLPGSSVCGISQARILEWVAIFYYRQSCWPRGWTGVSCIGRQILLTLSCQGSPYWFDKGSYLTPAHFCLKTSLTSILSIKSSQKKKKKNSLALGFAFALKCSSTFGCFFFLRSLLSSHPAVKSLFPHHPIWNNHLSLSTSTSILSALFFFLVLITIWLFSLH